MRVRSFSCCLFFFKQKTAYEMRISDWSSDVCSSDLLQQDMEFAVIGRHRGRIVHHPFGGGDIGVERGKVVVGGAQHRQFDRGETERHGRLEQLAEGDRKSTRLNSSH